MDFISKLLWDCQEKITKITLVGFYLLPDQAFHRDYFMSFRVGKKEVINDVKRLIQPLGISKFSKSI